MKSILLSVLGLICFISEMPFAQEQDSSNVNSLEPYENILDDCFEDEDYSLILEELRDLEEHPLDINSALPEDLMRIPGMTQNLAERIYERFLERKYSTVEELVDIDGMKKELLPYCKRFLYADYPTKKLYTYGSYTHRSLSELENRHGYKDGTFIGSKIKYVNRLKLGALRAESSTKQERLELDSGLLLKKDPGEKRVDEFITGYVHLGLRNSKAEVILGDYKIDIGEGLLIGKSTAHAKGNLIVESTRKTGNILRPSLSTREYSFFRGVAGSFLFLSCDAMLFYSHTPLSGSVDSLGFITSFKKDGLFRTESEYRAFHSSTETLFGGRIFKRFNNLFIGVSGYRSKLSLPIRDTYENAHPSLWMTYKSLDISYKNNSVDIFTEYSIDPGGHSASVAGCFYEPTNSMSISVIARDIQREYFSIHGNDYGTSAQGITSERGMYCGMQLKCSEDFQVSAYCDRSYRPYTNKLDNRSSDRTDFNLQGNYRVDSRTEVVTRYIYKTSETTEQENDMYGREFRSQQLMEREIIRFTLDHALNSSLMFVNRIERNCVQVPESQAIESGILLSQSIKLRIRTAFQLQLHLSVFHTDSYDSRIYEIETDVPGAYSNPALFGKGVRFYAVLQYSMTQGLRFSAKYGHTEKYGVTYLGSGKDQIDGNTLNVITLQLDATF